MDTRVSRMALVRELDKKWLKARPSGPYGNSPPFFLEADCIERLPEIAREWGVTFEEFKLYVALRGYVNLVSEGDYRGLPSVACLAGRLDVQPSELIDYLQEQLLLIENSRNRALVRLRRRKQTPRSASRQVLSG